MKGFSPRNPRFAGASPEADIAQQLLRDLPRGHITHLLDHVLDAEPCAWYAVEAVKHGWIRSVITPD
jgi:hypothetical protein